MINEIFAGHDPVTPIPLMSPAQLDNELERIHRNMGGNSIIGPKINLDLEYDRGFKAGLETVYHILKLAITTTEKLWLAGYDKGYAAGRDGEAKVNLTNRR